jgi:putative colanic acid biosynthesis acetyltransferase WcaF
MQNSDPYLVPAFSLRNKLRRFAWGIVYLTLFRTSLRPMHEWRGFLLRCFGAKIGPNPRIYAGARIWAPWNLVCEELVAVADGATIYNPKKITLGSHSIVSQEAYLCGATHDYEDPGFPFVASEITIGAHAWICARATVQPGVTVGEGAVLALASVATKNLEPWTVYAGMPAKKIKTRTIRNPAGTSADVASSSR